MSALSRRQVFLSGGAVAAALAVPYVGEAANLDATLIAVCREAEAAATTYHRIWNAEGAGIEIDGIPEGERLSAPVAERMDAMQDQIAGPQATTLEGLAAKARALVAYDDTFADPDYKFHGWEESVSASIIRDLLAMTGGAA